MTANRDELYAAWVAADDAWQAELERQYGKDAGDARADSARNAATPALAALKQAFLDAGDAYRQGSPLAQARGAVSLCLGALTRSDTESAAVHAEAVARHLRALARRDANRIALSWDVAAIGLRLARASDTIPDLVRETAILIMAITKEQNEQAPPV